MTLVCFSSQKGSPGATATSLAVAASLKVAKGRRKVLLEADATGGTLAIRYQLPVEPGLLTLAAAVRGGLDSSDGLWRHAQELPGGLPVIVCPDGPEQVHAAMAAGGAQLGRFLNNLRDVDVMCDVGRLAPDSPALPFVAEASAVLMVARPTAEQLQPAARRMLMLRPHVANLGWVLVGQKPYGPADVESTYEFPVVGVMADDPRSVTSLERGTVSKRLRRQPFIRSATTLADTLSGWLAPLTSAGDGAVAAQAKAQSPEPDPEPDIQQVTDEVTALNGDAAPMSETAVAGRPPGQPVDLSLLPPPTGEPDPSPPHPEPNSIAQALEPSDAPEAGFLPPEPYAWPEPDEQPALDALPPPTGPALAPPRFGRNGDEPAAETLADWDDEPQDEPEPPRLISAPLQGPPQDAFPGPNPIDDPDADTAIFPPDRELAEFPPPPPPAPVGERPLPVSESGDNGLLPDEVTSDGEQPSPPFPEAPPFGDLDIPNGLTWSDIELDQDGAESPADDHVPLGEDSKHSTDLEADHPEGDDDREPEPEAREPEPEGDSEAEVPAVPPVPPASLALPDDDLDAWDGAEFTITADLDKVFTPPDFDAGPIAQEREVPPMPPIPSIPPLPPPSTQLPQGRNGDHSNQPSPFPHEETDPEGRE